MKRCNDSTSQAPHHQEHQFYKIIGIATEASKCLNIILSYHINNAAPAALHPALKAEIKGEVAILNAQRG